MKTGPALCVALLSALQAQADDPGQTITVGLAGGVTTSLTGGDADSYLMPYTLFERSRFNLSLFEAGWRQPLTEDGLFSASLTLNWEEYFENWVEDDATHPSLNLIATFSGEHNVSLFMFKYSHALWLNDIDNRQTTNLAVYSGMPVWKESVILIPEVGIDLFTDDSLKREFDLDHGVTTTLPYASLMLIGFLGDNTQWIASARHQWLSEKVTDLPAVEADGRSDISLALQYMY